jgi:hypothetical protein
VADARKKGLNWAPGVMTGRSQPDDFTPHTILLVGEF